MVVWSLGGPVAPPAALAPTDLNLWTRVWQRPTRPGYETRMSQRFIP